MNFDSKSDLASFPSRVRLILLLKRNNIHPSDTKGLSQKGVQNSWLNERSLEKEILKSESLRLKESIVLIVDTVLFSYKYLSQMSTPLKKNGSKFKNHKNYD